MKRLVRNRAGKLYVDLYETLRRRIESGEWREGGLIPAEYLLCAEYGVSRITVKAALTMLVTRGYLVRRQGKGTFVRRLQDCQPAGGEVAPGRLAGEISHRINNPLAIIGEKAGWLQDLLADEEKELRHCREYEDILDKIRRQIMRVRDVTWGITDAVQTLDEIKRRRKE